MKPFIQSSMRRQMKRLLRYNIFLLKSKVYSLSTLTREQLERIQIRPLKRRKIRKRDFRARKGL
jgi:hypothetical protein